VILFIYLSAVFIFYFYISRYPRVPRNSGWETLVYGHEVEHPSQMINASALLTASIIEVRQIKEVQHFTPAN
jgi:hypothetical protein